MNAHRDQHNTVVLIQSPKMFDSNYNLIGSIELRYSSIAYDGFMEFHGYHWEC